MRSLALQIYLFSVLAVLVTLGAHIASFMLFSSARTRDLGPVSETLIDELAREHADPDAAHARPDHRRHRGPFEVALYTPAGALLVAATDPAPPPPDAATVARLARAPFVELGRHVVARGVHRDGRLVAVGVVRHRPPPLLPMLWPLLGSLAIMAALAFAFARHLARPLRTIAAAARRFGAGDTAARAALHRRDEIGAVARAFDDAADRVVLLMSSQQTLMANVSHELRTPLARIRVALDLLIDGVEPQAALELLPGVAEDLTDLERLIDDIMTAARFDLSQAGAHPAGVPLRLEPTAPAEVIADAAERFRARCDTHPLHVEVAAELPPLPLDRVLVRRAVDNLLQNARRYSDPGHAIRLTAVAAADGVRVSVIDDGIGMSADEMRHVFTPFFRGDQSRSRATGGAGLGLALVQQVVEAHGGAIAIDSAPGAGTRVSFTLPAEPG